MSRWTIGLAAVAISTPVSAQVVTSTYINRGNQSVARVPMSVSRVGADGDFTFGVTPMINGQVLPAQVDVLRTAEDGSIRHALVTFRTPNDLDAGLDEPFDVQWLNQVPPQPPSFSYVVPASVDLQLQLQMWQGDVLVADAGAVLSSANPLGEPGVSIRHFGRLMREIDVRQRPINQTTSQPDDDFLVIWRLRAYSGEPSLHVSCIVERSDPYTGNGDPRPLLRKVDWVKMVYNATPAVPANEVTLYEYDEHTETRVLNPWAPPAQQNVINIDEEYFIHLERTRYRLEAWTEGPLETVERRPNYDYWVKGRFAPPYRLTNETTCPFIDLTPEKVDSIFSRHEWDQDPVWNHINWSPCSGFADGFQGRNDEWRPQGILQPCIIKDYMGETSYRFEIGTLPAWWQLYLLVGGYGTYQRNQLTDGNAAAAYPVHVRDAAGDPGFNVSQYPQNSGTHPYADHPLPSSLPAGEPSWMPYPQPDHAHTPALAYCSYLMTGDHYFAEELSFWASYHAALHSLWQGLAVHYTPRAQAWMLRDITHAVHVLPDEYPELVDYFKLTIDNYMDNWNNNVRSRPIPYLGAITHSSGRWEWVNSAFTSIWQEAFVAWSVGNTADKGYGGPLAEEFRDWMATKIIEAYTNDDAWVGPDGNLYYSNPLDAMPYSQATSLWDTHVEFNGAFNIVVYDNFVRDYDNWGELWFRTKQNEDNSYQANVGLTSMPGAGGEWPLEDPGWGRGFHSQDPNPTRHNPYNTESAWIALVSGLNGDHPDAERAWEVMQSVIAHQGEHIRWGVETLPNALPPSSIDMAGMVRLEVFPKTAGIDLGAPWPEYEELYRCFAYYLDEAGREVPLDVSHLVTWKCRGDSNLRDNQHTGDLKLFTNYTSYRNDIKVTTNGARYGMFALWAELGGVSSAPAYLVSTTDDVPRVLHAGWEDTYVVRNQPSLITFQARIADNNDDVRTVLLKRGGLTVPLNDLGQKGDVMANDGIWTWTGPSTSIPSNLPEETYWTLFVQDATGLTAPTWPYFTVGAGGGPQTPGNQTMPWVSENYGFGPRLAATGLVDFDGPGGPITMHVKATQDEFDEIRAYWSPAGSTVQLDLTFADNGVVPDQVAGDGIWSASWDSPVGDYERVIDFVPVHFGPLRIGDVYPRFRIHRQPTNLQQAEAPQPRP